MQKTWFLAPDFNFIPDGELRLGMILKYPNRPTLALASLDPESPISANLPGITILTETDHAHSTDSSHATTASIFARALYIASGSGNATVSRYQDHAFGPVDHEVRLFSRALAPETVSAILQIDAVIKFINGGPFGRFRKRPVYVITGLRVVKQALAVSRSGGRGAEVAVGAGVSPVALGAPVPVEAGGGLSFEGGRGESHSYSTAPGIVFAYRLSVIREKTDGNESEVFSDSTAFMTGNDDDSEEGVDVFEVADFVVKENDSTWEVDRSILGDEALAVFKGDQGAVSVDSKE